MFRDAGFSIAFNADDVQVKKAADAVIEDKDLTKILAYLLR
jgi:phosphoserine phosphatase